MPRPGPNVTSDADTQPGSDSLFPTGFSGGGALVRSGSVGTGEIADGSVAAADLNLASVATALAARGEFTGTYATLTKARMAQGLARRLAGQAGSTVMATPPTITAGSTFTGSAFIEVGTPVTTGQVSVFSTYTNTKFTPANAGTQNPVSVRSLGTKPATLTISFTPCVGSTMGAALNPVVTGGGWRIAFRYFGQKFAFGLYSYNSSGYYRIKVDGQYVSRTPTALPGGPQFTTVDFTSAGGVASRLIEIETTGISGLGVLQMGQTDSIVDPGPLPGPSIALVGDSFVVGTGATYPGITDLGMGLMEHLGCLNHFIDGAGSTGYYSAATSGTYLTRQTSNYPNVIQPAGGVDLVVTFGSINDTGGTSAQIIAQAKALWALYGTVPVIAAVAADQAPRTSGMATVAAALQTAAASTSNVLGVCDMTLDLSGTGSTTSTNSGGNADYFRIANGHPAQAGHDWYAARMAAFIRNLVGA